MLLSPSAFDRQIRQPLIGRDRSSSTHPAATFVVAPTNLVSLRLIDWIQHWNARQGETFKNDVGDAWNINKTAFANLLSVLFECRDRVIILSGDIHYGSAVRLEYWSHDDLQADPRAKTPPHVLVQLTSSAIRNSEAKTRVVHTKLKSLLPEFDQDWVGWMQPKGKSETAKRAGRRPRSGDSSPESQWRYRIHWLDRQPAQVFRRVIRWLKPKRHPKRWIDRLVALFSCFWQNRWIQEGKEVVGRNNIGVVCFLGTESLETDCVAQDLYWYPNWKHNQVVSSRFVVSIDSTRLD
jgi:hypothetical protein